MTYYLLIGLLFAATPAQALTADSVVTIDSIINGTPCAKQSHKGESVVVDVSGITYQKVGERIRILATINAKGADDARFTVVVEADPKEIICEPLGNGDFKHFYIKASDSYEL